MSRRTSPDVAGGRRSEWDGVIEFAKAEQAPEEQPAAAQPSVPLRRRIRVGPADDPAEREADRLADRVRA
ncbi:MAG: hypothetical protein ACRDZZ_13375, partial [Ilumatobacteraceae bacterium]